MSMVIDEVSIILKEADEYNVIYVIVIITKIIINFSLKILPNISTNFSDRFFYNF